MTPTAPAQPEDEDIDLGRYIDILLANKWLIAAITGLVLACGIAYALMAKPVYESNILIQVEDTEGSKGVLAEAGAAFEFKTPSSAEMEIIRSRMIIGQAVEATKLNISAVPRYVPYIGGWMARRASELSDPGFLGFSGYVSGTERIVVPQFNVPTGMEGAQFMLTAKAGGQYALDYPGGTTPLTGTVGTLLRAEPRMGRSSSWSAYWRASPAPSSCWPAIPRCRPSAGCRRA